MEASVTIWENNKYTQGINQTFFICALKIIIQWSSSSNLKTDILSRFPNWPSKLKTQSILHCLIEYVSLLPRCYLTAKAITTLICFILCPYLLSAGGCFLTPRTLSTSTSRRRKLFPLASCQWVSRFSLTLLFSYSIAPSPSLSLSRSLPSLTIIAFTFQIVR